MFRVREKLLQFHWPPQTPENPYPGKAMLKHSDVQEQGHKVVFVVPGYFTWQVTGHMTE